MSTKEPRIRILMELPNKPVKTVECSTVDEAVSVLLRYLCEVCPTYEVVSRIILTLDYEKLLKDLGGFILIAPEGVLLTPGRTYTVEEALFLVLVGMHVGVKLGKVTKASLSADELSKITVRDRKSISNRLGELVGQNMVEKLEDDTYRITSIGIKYFQEFVLPKLKKTEQKPQTKP